MHELDDFERLAREALTLAGAATAGPWYRGDNGDMMGRDGLTCLGFADYIDDANFIAASRALVPSLADAVLRLVAEARLARAWLADKSQEMDEDNDSGHSHTAFLAYRAFLAKSEGGG